MQLEEVLSHIQPHLHDNTIVVCTMNGLKHERLIQQYVSIDRIVRGVTTWTAGIDQPGHTHLMGQGPVEVGVSCPRKSVDIIVNLLQNAELKGVKVNIYINQFGRKYVLMEQLIHYVLYLNVIWQH